MSAQPDPSDTLRGLSTKDLSMLIVAAAVAIFFVTIAAIFIIAAENSHGTLNFTGSIDVGNLQQEFMLFIGAAIAMIAGALGVNQTLRATRKP